MLPQQSSLLSGSNISQLSLTPFYPCTFQSPHWLKFLIHQQCILLKCTNLKSLWVTKLTPEEILKDKQVYVKYLNAKDLKSLLELFYGLMNGWDHKAKYGFQETKDGHLEFRFQKQIEFFPFVWKFKLTKVRADLTQIFCREIVNPLTFTLDVQAKRIQSLKKKMELIQKDYIRKMTDTQKKMYKSPLLQTQDQLNSLTKMDLPQLHQLKNKIILYRPYQLDTFTNQCFTKFLKNFICLNESSSIPPLKNMKGTNLTIPKQQGSKSNSNSPITSQSNSTSKNVKNIFIDQQELNMKRIYTKQDQKKNKKKNKDIDIDFL